MRKTAKQTQTKTPTSDAFSLLIAQTFGATCVREYKFHPVRRWRFDYALPDYKIAIEIEGAVWRQGRHTRGSGFVADIEKYNTATSMGWSLLRFATGDQFARAAFDLIRQTITSKTDISNGREQNIGV